MRAGLRWEEGSTLPEDGKKARLQACNLNKLQTGRNSRLGTLSQQADLVLFGLLRNLDLKMDKEVGWVSVKTEGGRSLGNWDNSTVL